MQSEDSSTPLSAKKKRGWARFSLLSLLLVSMAMGSGVLLGRNLNAWQLLRVFQDFPREVKTAYISPDGSRIATLIEGEHYVLRKNKRLEESSAEERLNLIQIWSTYDGSLLCKFEGGYPNFLGHGGGADFSWSPQARWIQLASHYGIVHWERVWDTTTNRELPLFRNETKLDYGFCLQFSTNDRYVVYGYQGKLRSYDAQNRTHTDVTLDGWHDCRLSMDAKWLAVVEENKSLLLWDMSEGKAVWRVEPSLLNKNILSKELAFSPNSKLLAVSTYDPNETHLFDVSTGKILRSVVGIISRPDKDRTASSNPRGPFSPDNLSLLTVDKKDSLLVWNVLSGEERFRLKSKDMWPPHWAFSMDGNKIVSGEFPDEAWNALTGQPIPFFPSDKRWLYFQSFTADGKTVVLADGKQVRVLKMVRPEAWYGVAWIPLFWSTLLLVVALVWSARRDILCFRNS